MDGLPNDKIRALAQQPDGTLWCVFHRGFETDGGGGILVTQQLSKSVDCQVGEVTQFIENAFGPRVAAVEEGAGEVGVVAGPIVDGGTVDAGGRSLVIVDPLHAGENLGPRRERSVLPHVLELRPVL